MDLNKVKKNGFFIDIGISDYTYLLEHKYNWTGVCIDANESVIQNIQKQRPNTRCITGLVWPLHRCLDFEIQDNNPTSGRIRNIPHNIPYSGLCIKEIIMGNTIDKILDINNVFYPSVVDYIALDTNGSEIYILNYLFKQNKFNVSNISIKYSSYTYLQKLVKYILSVNKLYINKIDDQYIDISVQSNIEKSLWISDRGIFSMLNKNYWYGYLDKHHIDNLKQTNTDMHCVYLSNGINNYKICNNELYEIISDNCHKITDGKWITYDY